MRHIMSLIVVLLMVSGCTSRWMDWYHTPQQQQRDLKAVVATRNSPKGWTLRKRDQWEYDHEYKYYNRDIELYHAQTKTKLLTADGLNNFKSYSSNYVHNGKLKPCTIVYIGKWQYDTQLQHDIRFIVRQLHSRTKKLGATYETKDEKNEKISLMPLTLIAEPGLFPGTVLALIRFDEQRL